MTRQDYVYILVRRTSILVTALLVAALCYGQERANIRGMGMAQTAVASALGLDAVGINPAILALPGAGKMSLTVLPLGMYVESDFFSYDLYARYLKDRTPLLELPESDKQVLLQSFQSRFGHARGEAVARIFGIALRVNSTGGVAFTVDYGLVGAARIPREYARLLLYGNLPGSAFDLDGLALQGYWMRRYGLSYGQYLPSPSFLKWLAAGVAMKLVQGYGYYELHTGATRLRTASDGSISGVVPWFARWTAANSLSRPMDNLFQNPAGYGVGFDIGVAAGVEDFLTFGASVTNIGSIRWSRDVNQRSADSALTTRDPDVYRKVFALLNQSDGTGSASPFSSSLPSLLRVGVAAQIDRIPGSGMLPGQVLFGVEYAQAVGPRSPLSYQTRFSFGLEYRPIIWLPIRTGVALSGSTGSHIAFGFGLNFRTFDLDVATEDILLLLEGTRHSTGSVGIGMRVHVP